MKIPGVYIPEFASLLPDDRKNLVRRCEESDEMHRLYARVKLLTWISVPVAVAVTVFAGMFLFHWAQDLVLALATFLGMSCLAITRFALFMGKIRLIREEVTKGLGERYED